ncbi:MAG: hypothetical protein IIC83_08880 [Chloroflexi bacterium]|nr:hypothetical protein [Chloroflexota bacterium]
MVKGFSHGVAPDLIAEKPEMTSSEVAEIALSRGLAESNSSDPVRSLGNTLAKEVREGRLKESVRAELVRGVLRYYPVSAGQPTGIDISAPTTGPYEETVSIRLPKEHIEIADLMVEVGKYRSKSEALAWFVAQGIHNKQSVIAEVKKAAEQIRAIKGSIPL